MEVLDKKPKWTIGITTRYMNTKPLTERPEIHLVVNSSLDKEAVLELAKLLMEVAEKL